MDAMLARTGRGDDPARAWPILSRGASGWRGWTGMFGGSPRSRRDGQVYRGPLRDRAGRRGSTPSATAPSPGATRTSSASTRSPPPLILRNYLRVHPPQTWETVLAQAVKAEPQHAAPAARQVLFFSLQTRHSPWAIYPYSLPLSHFAEEMLGDADALAKTIKQEALSKQAKPLRAQSDPRRFVSASGGDATPEPGRAGRPDPTPPTTSGRLSAARCCPCWRAASSFAGARRTRSKRPLRVSDARRGRRRSS